MKVLLLNSRDQGGGAAQAAFRLFMGLSLQGISPRMVVAEKKTRNPDVVKVQHTASRRQTWIKNQFWMAQRGLIDNDRSGDTNTCFSLPYPGDDLSRTEVIKEADIVNLHWVSRMLSVESLGALLKTGKPVVWTLHDENPFTGGCHYRAGCEGFTRECSPCPQLNKDPFHLPSAVLRNKLQRWRGNLHIVTPSRWLGDTALRSRVFSRFPVHVIPNSLDTDLFCPGSRGEARRELGIPGESICILFTAGALDVKRKGFLLLVDALKRCVADPSMGELIRGGKVVLLTVGKKHPQLDDLGMPVHHLGTIQSEKQMVLAYRSADCFVQPSLEDNLPNTVLEAMACGIPVVGFETGGIPDMVMHEESGILCPVGDRSALAHGVIRMALESGTRERMGIAARLRVEEKYQLRHQAGNYLTLFEEILGPSSRQVETWKSQRSIRIRDRRVEVDATLIPAIRSARQLLLENEEKLRKEKSGETDALSGVKGRFPMGMELSESAASRMKEWIFLRGGWFFERLSYPVLRRVWLFVKWIRK